MGSRKGSKEPALRPRLARMDEVNTVLIPEEKVSRLEKLLELQTRSEEEWTEIKQMLAQYQLVAFSAPEAKGGLYSDKGPICAFSTIEKCHNYVFDLSQKIGTEITAMVRTIDLQELVSLAVRNRVNIYIDYREKGRFLCYYWNRQTLGAISKA